MKHKFLCLLLIVIYYNPVSAQQQLYTGGYYTINVGEFTVTALLDGTVPVDANKLLTSTEIGKIDRLLEQSYLTNPVETSINAYLVKIKDRLILIDTGAGELFKSPNSGNLILSLKGAGYKPEDITDILLTHIHADHSGGLSVAGKIQFPNAVVHLDKKEIEFWTQHEKPVPDEPIGYTANRPAYFVLKPYLDRGRVKTFDGATELFPGIKSATYYGHTSGHCAYVLQSNHEKLVFFGDLVHIGAVQFRAPMLANRYDFDKLKAAEQRKKIYTEAAGEHYLIAADHIPFPGFGRLQNGDDGYNWVPVNFSSTGHTK